MSYAVRVMALLFRQKGLNVRLHLLAVSAVVTAVGCAAQTETNGVGPETSIEPISQADGGIAPEPADDGGLPPVTPPNPPPTPPQDGGPPPINECAAIETEAERTLRPVDIVWVIDSSGSMRDEADVVQANINAFVQSIEASGVEDYRVVVVTDEGFVDVPPPLGTDTERFLLVAESVGSGEPQAKLLSEFERYRDFLRPDAITHFVIVTDDDENPLTASEFIAGMEGNLGHPFKVHAVASEDVTRMTCIFGICVDSPGCSNGDNTAADIGAQHYAAAEMTNGLTFSICTVDWSSLFAELAAAVSVSAPIPCELLVPEPPEGETLDPNKVNVTFTPAGETEALPPFPRVPGAGDCGSEGAWYYDDPSAPARILLCPEACDLAASGGKLDIALGCTTIIQ